MKKQILIATLATAAFLGIGAISLQASEISQSFNRGQHHTFATEHRLRNIEELTLIINGEATTITSIEQLREIAENYGRTILEESENLRNFRGMRREFLESNRYCLREHLGSLNCLRENFNRENFDLSEMRGRFSNCRGQRN